MHFIGLKEQLRACRTSVLDLSYRAIVKAAAVIGVLVVEQFGPYRRFVTSLINQNLPFTVIGEAVDGVEAVLKAQELRPDVVLMDITLPILNGFESARRIKALTSAPKIIFLTLQSDPEFVEEAFQLGACGFIAKNHAASQLIRALEAPLDRREATVSGCLVHLEQERKARAAVLAAGCCQSLRTLP
jgi:DNA-binding NarL/FixJ family response regulator